MNLVHRRLEVVELGVQRPARKVRKEGESRQGWTGMYEKRRKRSGDVRERADCTFQGSQSGARHQRGAACSRAILFSSHHRQENHSELVGADTGASWKDEGGQGEGVTEENQRAAS